MGVASGCGHKMCYNLPVIIIDDAPHALAVNRHTKPIGPAMEPD